MTDLDLAQCSYCGITEDIHLLDGVLVNEQDSGKISCIACYPDDGWCPCGIEHIDISIAPSLKPLYREWLRINIAKPITTEGSLSDEHSI